LPGSEPKGAREGFELQRFQALRSGAEALQRLARAVVDAEAQHLLPQRFQVQLFVLPEGLH